MIFELRKASVSVEDVEGDELILNATDETGARVGTISIYKGGGIVLESRVYGSQGSAVFDHPQDFFGSIIEWRDKAERFDNMEGEQNGRK